MMKPGLTLNRNLLLRFVTGFIVGPLVLLAVYQGGLILALGLGVVALAANLEFYRLVRYGEHRLLIACGLIGASFLVFAGYSGNPALYALIFSLLAIIGFVLGGGLRGSAVTLGGASYVGLPLSLFATIRSFPMGAAWIFTMLLTNWGTDSFAFICGHLFGRHNLAPRISPNKTVEGAVGGVLLGAAIGIGFNVLNQSLSVQAAGLAGLVALATIAGDLFESGLKRRFDVKDTGGILPGHGGILDRIDGLLFSCLVAWLYLLIVGRV